MELRIFRSMGCEVVVGGASPAELEAIQALFEERDAVFSRFRADSELNRVNRSAGRVVPVSTFFRDALGVALAAAATTGGLVDPTLGAALEAAGYSQDFECSAEDRRPPEPGSEERGTASVSPAACSASSRACSSTSTAL